MDDRTWTPLTTTWAAASLALTCPSSQAHCSSSRTWGWDRPPPPPPPPLLPRRRRPAIWWWRGGRSSPAASHRRTQETTAPIGTSPVDASDGTTGCLSLPQRASRNRTRTPPRRLLRPSSSPSPSPSPSPSSPSPPPPLPNRTELYPPPLLLLGESCPTPRKSR